MKAVCSRIGFSSELFFLSALFLFFAHIMYISNPMGAVDYVIWRVLRTFKLLFNWVYCVLEFLLVFTEERLKVQCLSYNVTGWNDQILFAILLSGEISPNLFTLYDRQAKAQCRPFWALMYMGGKEQKQFTYLRKLQDKREPWSSGKRRLWVRIPAPDTGWTFFTFICCKNCNVCMKRRKRGRGWPNFSKLN